MESIMLIASQTLLVALCAAAVTGLAVALVRRRAVREAWLAVITVIVLLITTALTALVATEWFAAGWFLCFPVLCASYPDGKIRSWPAAVLAALGVATATVYVSTGASVAMLAWWSWSAGAQLLGGLALLVHRYAKRLTAEDRSRVRWPLLGTLVELALFLFLGLGSSGAIATGGPLSVAAANLAGVWIPVTAAIGLVWPRMLDVDRMLRGFFVVVIAALPVIAAGIGAYRLSSSVWITALVTAILAIPSWRVGSWAADRIVYRGRPRSLAALRALGVRLNAQLDVDGIPDALINEIHDALGVERVVLEGPGERQCAVGEGSTAPVTRFPITYQGEKIAELAVVPRKGDLVLAEADAAVIAELCGQAAPALHGARVVGELVEARSRLADLRAGERARLRRDLHDDLVPALVGLRLAAAAISDFGRDDPRVVELADALQRDANSALGRTRELVDDLRPEDLASEGLLSTMRHRLANTNSIPMVRVDGPDGDLHLSPAVEVALLRIAQEAVTNARRHAHASVVDVALKLDSRHVWVVVADDGQGIGAPVGGAGIGLASMRARAAELHGHAEIRRGDEGGTIVQARFPLVDDTPQRSVGSG